MMLLELSHEEHITELKSYNIQAGIGGTRSEWVPGFLLIGVQKMGSLPF